MQRLIFLNQRFPALRRFLTSRRFPANRRVPADRSFPADGHLPAIDPFPLHRRPSGELGARSRPRNIHHRLDVPDSQWLRDGTPVTAVPIVIGDLAAGSTATARVFLNVPASVTRFSVVESGTVRNATGTIVSFSLSQSVIK